MIPGLDTAWVSVATRALETHSRLRRAIERVVEFGSPSMYLGCAVQQRALEMETGRADAAQHGAQLQV
jgi:hypothetical protein